MVFHLVIANRGPVLKAGRRELRRPHRAAPPVVDAVPPARAFRAAAFPVGLPAGFGGAFGMLSRDSGPRSRTR
ncbi:hypothetical protein [Rhodovulum sp. MB263]|uniref:hypothetical protein n=1 Tax=Rhodovulum sp. (strain MB263) TaxID=308754 RepID=UPI0009B728AF|nr:hypothetical protein [Rhodovulum sp. MB263]ARC88141.1 hypothetical protein B5V46_05715 [Rhodovulum sp. MB263]